MTASPVDAKMDVMQAATELETILHSRIATTLDMSLVNPDKKTTEQTLHYAALRQPFETPLLKAFKAEFGDIGAFRRVFATCPEIARQLGAWCADQYLIDELSESKLRRYEVKLEQRFDARRTLDNVQVLDAGLAELRSAFDFLEKEHARKRVAFDDQYSISPKVRELQGYLAREFELSPAQRCIVFVDRRKHARFLATLFKIIGTEHMRPAFLVGSNATETGEENMSFKEQVLALMKFRKGDINCLFATTVAEEGLDIPDCNLVVRFNLYATMISYVQSRGRARQKNSKFIHMIEMDNTVERHTISQVRYQEMAMRKFCQALPEDRRLIGNEDSLESLMAKEKSMRVYTEKTTGAKLTYGNALGYLAQFVSAIPCETDEPQHPTYVVTYQGSKFLAEVILPAHAPIPSAIGRACTKKTLAKRSAAFEACCELRKRGLINEHFVPTYQKRLPAMRNALLAVGMKNTGQYVMRTKPKVWELTRGSLPSELWLTVSRTRSILSGTIRRTATEMTAETSQLLVIVRDSTNYFIHNFR